MFGKKQITKNATKNTTVDDMIVDELILRLSEANGMGRTFGLREENAVDDELRFITVSAFLSEILDVNPDKMAALEKEIHTNEFL